MPTRRHALSALAAAPFAAVPIVATAADTTPADAELAAQFAEVTDACTFQNAPGILDSERERRVSVCDHLAERLFTTPTRSALGLAIKLRVLMLVTEGALIDQDPTSWTGAMLAAIMRDVDEVMGANRS